ncbi:MAG: site-specific integrase [Xenococcaceae cyanobacterium MO_188.B19]|nr:site-specific integrase [Xenococcaceae cyanobacterium MO_188.B19]
MREIDWKKDYHREFICPNCKALGMRLNGFNKGGQKRIFSCVTCNKEQRQSLDINIEQIADPINKEVIWYRYRGYKIKGFICPECDAEDIYFRQINKYGKKTFKCKNCQKLLSDSLDLKFGVISRFKNEAIVPVLDFNWEDDQWDLRTINSNFDLRDNLNYIIDYGEISQNWLKQEVKKYIYHLCKEEKSYGTIKQILSALRFFSRYLRDSTIKGFKQINRNVILDYLSQEKKITTKKLGGLRDFFFVGNVKGWFVINQDIIRDEDYPKSYRGNPDPLSDRVREQIEQNLHLLPDFIARMWIIGYFSAMRPSELALLKQDCLMQEGQYWKLVWSRKKNDDYHQIPISRTIAKVVQEQIEYVQNLFGGDWEYLFCHYRGLSTTKVLPLNIKPIKKVLPSNNKDPLTKSIRTLIKIQDIRDENGQPAKFSLKNLRTTRLTQLFEQGHDLAVVSAWAGHKHFATTSTYYTKVSCDLIEQEAGHIQKALVNNEGHRVSYESFPKSFWEKPQAHKLELSGTHINTPIYGYCGLDLDQDCDKFRACYTCGNFVATTEKLPQYIKTRDELRGKQSQALAAGQDVLVEQFGKQADQLDKIIASLQGAA